MKRDSLPLTCYTSFMATKCGEAAAIATIHVARMKEGHSFELMSGERRGNTTAPNQSTAIKTWLWIDTSLETSVMMWTSLHKAWPKGPLISHWFSTYNFVSSFGNQNIVNSKSYIAMLTINITDRFSQCLRLIHNYSYKGIPDQQKHKDQGVSKDFSKFSCCWIQGDGAAWSIHRCIHDDFSLW